jgi:hypothetical protein
MSQEIYRETGRLDSLESMISGRKGTKMSTEI